MDDYVVECEECEETSYVAAYQTPKFCPVCGRRAEIEKRLIDVDSWEIDEDE